MADGVQFRVAPQSLREFLDACRDAPHNMDIEQKRVLRKAGEIVRTRAAGRMAAKHGQTAAGYRTRVRYVSVVVEQRLRKTSRQHPEWGSWQMRHALLPALRASEPAIVREFEQATNRVVARFER